MNPREICLGVTDGRREGESYMVLWMQRQARTIKAEIVRPAGVLAPAGGCLHRLPASVRRGRPADPSAASSWPWDCAGSSGGASSG